MGEFAHGIHVYKKNKDQILQAILEIFQGSNYVPCESDDVDRAVAIIDSGQWVSVFDSDIYDNSFNKALSLQTDAHSVAFDLLDGDCLQAVLWKNGRRVNVHISEPEYIELRRTKSNCGNAQRWNAVTKDINTMQSVFESDDDATSKLFELSKVLEIPYQLTQMQYDYLEEIDGVDIAYLYFRDIRSKPPIPETPVFRWDGGVCPVPLNREVESVQLKKGMPPKNILHIGEIFVTVTDFVNVGMDGKGVTVYFIGKSMESESVVFERVQIFDCIAFEGNKLVAEAEFEKITFQDDRKGYYAKLDGVEIFHSITFSDYCIASRTNKSKEKKYHPFSIKVFGKALNMANEYEAALFVHPNENYTEGYFYREILGDVVFR
ncbi:MAG: hypothetical protein BWY15_02199 [Firmicutes bacterium ADurb.Bin193]|nr:MAG: hypothetical protein BWY15_02199 [Firmicutes bacterium ADurb.Bin193]